VTPPSPARASDRAPDEVSLLTALTVVVEQWRVVARVAGVLVLAVVAWTLLRTRTYTAVTAFMPQASEGARSSAAGLAARFGVTLPAADPGQSPQFYGQLATSEELLRHLVDSAYATGPDAPPTSLVELLEAGGGTAAEQRMEAVQELRERIRVTLDAETGVVRVGVTTRWPAVSQQVAAGLLALLNDFNLTRRQSRAGAERRFVEGRLQEAATELRAAEDELQGFLQRNRQYQDSPQLQFAFDRLQRAVSMRQGVYTSLVERYEEARIEEVRDTPVLTVVEPPRLPERPDRRRVLVKAVMALLVGLVAGAAVVGWRHALSTARATDPASAARLAGALDRLRAEVGRWWPRRG
jgi:uncharacterized protein involved in exopolysaccharide biosynthesis